MAKESSVHFNQLNTSNAAHDVDHVEREEEPQPHYLLRPGLRVGNFAIKGSCPKSVIIERIKTAESKLSGAAKKRGSHPFWHGVLNLPDKNNKESWQDYKERVEKLLERWQRDFEHKTKCKVEAIHVHLDEGIEKHGQVKYNLHAHVFVNKVIEEKVLLWRKERTRHRLYSPGRKEMSEIQDLTSTALELKRGETLGDRGGKRGRKHIKSGDLRNLRRHENHFDLFLAQENLAAKEAELASLKRYLDSQRAEQIAKAAELKAAKADLAAQQAELVTAKAQLSAKQAELATAQASAKRLTTEVEAVKTEAKTALSREEFKGLYKLVYGALKGSSTKKPADFKRLKELFDAKNPVIESWAKYIDTNLAPDIEAVLCRLRGEDFDLFLEQRAGVKKKVVLQHANSITGDAEVERFADSPQLKQLLQPIFLMRKEHTDLYLLPKPNEAGKRLAFEDIDNKIAVKIPQDWDVVEAALKLATSKWPEGFYVDGSPEFRELAWKVADSLEIRHLILNPPDAVEPEQAQAQRPSSTGPAVPGW